jgi:hypothetical protein
VSLVNHVHLFSPACFNVSSSYSGKLVHSELDDRALDALKEFPVDGALAVLQQFLESNLEHVSNKSAFLCGIMKTYRSVNLATIFSQSADIDSLICTGKKFGLWVWAQSLQLLSRQGLQDRVQILLSTSNQWAKVRMKKRSEKFSSEVVTR